MSGQEGKRRRRGKKLKPEKLKLKSEEGSLTTFSRTRLRGGQREPVGRGAKEGPVRFSKGRCIYAGFVSKGWKPAVVKCVSFVAASVRSSRFIRAKLVQSVKEKSWS